MAVIIKPQPAQERFLSSPADIAIYGGAAGGGKSWSLLIEPLRHISRSDFGATIFRRTRPEITAQGGLWDASAKIYPLLGAEPNLTDLSWRFRSGAKVRFAHMQHEQDVYAWKSAEIPLIEFDQLETFTEKQWWYMFSRNRSTIGIRPYVRAGCNPEPGWLADLLAWWIDDVGYARADRAGKVRWFIRDNEKIHWADSEAALPLHPPGTAKTLAFHSAKLSDNQILMQADPGYLGNLLAMHKVDRERLLGGNWKVTDTTGVLLEKGWLILIDALPVIGRWVRYWDKAGTQNDGDWSAGVLIGRDQWGLFYIADVVRGQWSAGQRNRVIKETAALDRIRYGWVETWLEEEGGSGGKESAELSVLDLAGYDVHTELVSTAGDKATRFKPFAAQAEAGNVRVLKAAWTADYIDEVTTFPKGKHDDQCDGSSGAFNKLALLPIVDPAGTIHVQEGGSVLDQIPKGAW